MFGEQHPPGLPGMPQHNSGNQTDPEVMLAHAELTAAYARYMQRVAPRQPHHSPLMHAPAAPMVHAPPAAMPKPTSAPSSKRAPAPDSGSSLWTLVMTFVIGAVCGGYCVSNMPDPGADGRQQQQQRSSRSTSTARSD
jgi:hypothetical protein